MKAAKPPIPRHTLLYVVHRTRQDIYHALTANFADASDVNVVLERRSKIEQREVG